MAAAQFCKRSQCMRGRQANQFLGVFPIFEWGGISKRLMTGPRETVRFVPIELNLPLCFTSGSIEGLEETKLTVSLVASH